ncbi:MAG: Rpn family recombination-promoting nuclease/putative transposase, partial [Spirochaetia bacterium]
MNRHIKPTSDLFIRYLLGSESNEDVLLDFINSFLEDEGFPPAVSLEIKNPFNLKKLPDAKESVLDVKAQDSRGRIFDVEIQVIGNQHYIKRSVYYWAKLYESQLGDGEFYNLLKPVICINVLDFSVFPELKQAHSCFMLTETEEKEYILTDDMQI